MNGSWSKSIARYGRVDLIMVDELGYLELDRRGAELLFQVLTERKDRSAIAIASIEPFFGWTNTFTDPRLRAAIVDRLTFAGQIIETGTDSYRLATPAGSSRTPRRTRARQDAELPRAASRRGGSDDCFRGASRTHRRRRTRRDIRLH